MKLRSADGKKTTVAMAAGVAAAEVVSIVYYMFAPWFLSPGSRSLYVSAGFNVVLVMMLNRIVEHSDERWVRDGRRSPLYDRVIPISTEFDESEEKKDVQAPVKTRYDVFKEIDEALAEETPHRQCTRYSEECWVRDGRRSPLYDQVIPISTEFDESEEKKYVQTPDKKRYDVFKESNEALAEEKEARQRTLFAAEGGVGNKPTTDKSHTTDSIKKKKDSVIDIHTKLNDMNGDARMNAEDWNYVRMFQQNKEEECQSTLAGIHDMDSGKPLVSDSNMEFQSSDEKVKHKSEQRKEAVKENKASKDWSNTRGSIGANE